MCSFFVFSQHNHKSLRVEKKTVDVIQDDIDNRLADLSKSMGVWEPVERPVEIGDTITADIKGVVKEKVIIDQQGVNFALDNNTINNVSVT